MFYPIKTETFTSTYALNEVIEKLKADLEPNDNETRNWFKGSLKENTFTISLILKRPNNFVPVIYGVLDKDENGRGIVVVKYELFPATRRFLVFWTAITILLSLFFAIPYQAYLYAAITLSACLVNYIITRENFNIQVRKSRRALKKVLGVKE